MSALTKIAKTTTTKLAELIAHGKDSAIAARCRAEMAHVLFTKLNKTQRAEFVAHLLVCGGRDGGKPSPLYKALSGRGNA